MAFAAGSGHGMAYVFPHMLALSNFSDDLEVVSTASFVDGRCVFYIGQIGQLAGRGGRARIQRSQSRASAVVSVDRRWLPFVPR
jgi:hypothetical protein